MDVSETHPEDRSFAASLRDAVEASGLSLSHLHRLLRDLGSPVSVSTLSYWRSGARRPEGAHSRVAITELERILGIPAGGLTDLVGMTKRPGQASGPGPAFSDEYETTLAETYAALDADPTTYLREVSSSTLAQVGPDGALRGFRCRMLVQATTKLVRSVGLVSPVEEGAADQPAFAAIAGGRIAFDYIHPSGTMVGSRVELDAPIGVPDTALIEFELALPDGYPPQYAVAHGATRKAREMVVWVQFDPEALPDWVAEFEEDGDSERDLPRRPLRGTTAHAVRHGFGPGFFGVKWGFDGR
ncbi:hypothetical protein J2Y69_000387 [Microbacterium resistens]|uniref:XRE family transcriptional regulator n=1 Tax=Microbacterium resistens TaxID=156977 RepID=A0ABU1S869_9MICO|nr:hypothetical protein [Microbacterium resistens]MDR6865805.1 hypothetical protein [Microbacterium resistens]